MRSHHLLLKKLEEAIDIASYLSTHERDQYAHAVEALMIARAEVAGISLDRSDECKCGCHTNTLIHCMPCGCYSGNPVLDDQ
jgi:hypothetical protein